MAKAAGKATTPAWFSPREACELVTNGYDDGALAERLITKRLVEGKMGWTCTAMALGNDEPTPTPPGFVGERNFWQPIDVGYGISHIEIDWEHGRAWHATGYKIFVLDWDPPSGPPIKQDFRPLPRVWGFALSREDVIALLPAGVASTPAEPVGSAAWALATARDLLARGVIREGMTKAAVGRELEGEAEKAVKAGVLKRALKASYMEDKLEAWGIWPLVRLKPPKQK